MQFRSTSLREARPHVGTVNVWLAIFRSTSLREARQAGGKSNDMGRDLDPLASGRLDAANDIPILRGRQNLDPLASGRLDFFNALARFFCLH